jgi:hypothetical protein
VSGKSPFPRISEEKKIVKSWHVFLWIGLGSFAALLTPINSIVASLMTPLLSAITSGKGSYV